MNEKSLGVINLATFDGGVYANYSNASVGAGTAIGTGENRAWTDNFQVGAVPEPASLGLFAAAGALLIRRRQV